MLPFTHTCKHARWHFSVVSELISSSWFQWSQCSMLWRHAIRVHCRWEKFWPKICSINLKVFDPHMAAMVQLFLGLPQRVWSIPKKLNKVTSFGSFFGALIQFIPMFCFESISHLQRQSLEMLARASPNRRMRWAWRSVFFLAALIFVHLMFLIPVRHFSGFKGGSISERNQNYSRNVVKFKLQQCPSCERSIEATLSRWSIQWRNSNFPHPRSPCPFGC